MRLHSAWFLETQAGAGSGRALCTGPQKLGIYNLSCREPLKCYKQVRDTVGFVI